MREFQVFVTDDRYSVPSLYIVQAQGRRRAIEIAQGIFAESLHHLGVEVFDERACILTLGIVAPKTDAPPSPRRRPRPAGDPQA